MSTYVFGPFTLDSDSRSLRHGSRELAAGSKVAETLLALIERAGQVCTTQQLIDRIWPEGFVEPAILPQNIYILRKILREHWDGAVIETVRRRGYRFVAPLRVVEQAAEATPPLRTRRSIAQWRWPAVIASAVLIATLPYSAGPVKGTSNGLSARSRQLYAIGRYYWDSRTRAGVLKSIGYFQKIVREEPHNALGYSGLADAYYTIADYDFGPRSGQTYHAWERANVARALALDPTLSAAHSSQGMLLGSVDHNLGAAHHEFQVAIDLDPQNAVAHHWFGVILMYEGKTAQARSELERAAQLDPTAPAINRWLAMANYVTRRYGPAVGYYLQALDLKPSDEEAALMLGLAYEGMHAYPAALSTYQRFERACKCAAPMVLEARTLALMGKYSQARSQLARAGAAPRKGKVDPLDMAAALIALDERTQAMKWLRAYARSDYFAGVWLNLDPRLDAARSDPNLRPFFAAERRASCSLAC